MAALSLLAGPASAAWDDPDPDPFPLGACVRASVVDPKPVCLVIADPTK